MVFKGDIWYLKDIYGIQSIYSIYMMFRRYEIFRRYIYSKTYLHYPKFFLDFWHLGANVLQLLQRHFRLRHHLSELLQSLVVFYGQRFHTRNLISTVCQESTQLVPHCSQVGQFVANLLRFLSARVFQRPLAYLEDLLQASLVSANISVQCLNRDRRSKLCTPKR